MLKQYLDHAAAPAIAIAIALWDCRSGAWLAWAAFGAVLFTFIEYWTHRVVLHRLYWHSTHERHHTHPSEPSLFPFWYTPAIFAGFFLILPLSIFAGFLIGYAWFLFWHHALHRWELERHPWVRRYANWHNLHHADLPVNYGITHPAWDFLFGTYRSAKR